MTSEPQISICVFALRGCDLLHGEMGAKVLI